MRRISALVTTVACVVGSTMSIAPISAEAVGTTFVVNSIGDRDDAVVDGTCRTSVGDCTLRAALTEANANTTSHVTIGFDLPGSGVRRIKVGTRLPLIDNGTAGITIDGYTQPGSRPNTDSLGDNGVRLVEVTGNGPAGIEGFIFLGSNNVLRGMVVRSFKRAVRITGRSANFNELVGNIVGLQADGSVDPTYTRMIGSPCVDINSGASRNRVGMPGNENRNVISGCYEKAIVFYNQYTWKNYVQNNIIGLDPTGTQRRRSDFGIDINWSANGTVVGGLGNQERNVISGNINAGVEISHGTGTVNNSVIGNYIGTDLTGTRSSAETGNNGIGVRLEGVPDCGNKSCAQDAGRQTVTDNVIVNSGWGGILVDKGVHDSTIARNRIGVTLDGTVAGNVSFGVRLSSGAKNITVGPGNIIAGSVAGVQMTPFSSDPVGTTSTVTTSNRITQNSISDSSGFGIDLQPFNSVNTGATADPNVNEGILPPTLVSVGGQVRAATCAGCTVELFAAGRAAGLDGPGITYVTTALADQSGSAVFARPASGWPSVLTATVTSAAGSTSEFARNLNPNAETTAPNAPTAVTATAADASATVAFSSALNGGAATSYVVRATDLTNAARGGQTASATTSPITVTGLTNGDQYRFTVTAVNPSGQSAASSASNTVVPSSTNVASTTPSSFGPGASWREVRINGTGFVPGSLVSFGDGIVVKSITSVTPTRVTVKISIDGNAVPGERSVTVTSPSGEVATCPSCFTVNPPPAVTSLSPGSPTAVTAVAGDATATVSFQAPTSGGAPTSYVVRATDLTNSGRGGQTVTGAASPLVVPGLTNGDAYTFTVSATNAAGEGPSSAVTQPVTPKAAVASTVALTSVSPSSVGQDAYWRQVRIVGSGFGAGTTVTLGAGATVKSLVVNDARTLTIKVSVAPDAIVGSRNVVVTAANGDVATCTGCLTVAPAPVVASINPNHLPVGVITRVDITGSNFDAYPVLSVSGSDVVVEQVVRMSSTVLRATISVAAGAALGSRAVTVRNGDGGRAFSSLDVS